MKAYFFLLILVFLISCSNNNDKTPKNLPDVKIISVPFYKELFETNVDSIPTKVPAFIYRYSPFFELFCSHVINIGYPEEKRFNLLLQQFVSDFRMRNVYNEINKKFPDTKEIDYKLEKAFKYFSFYFPNLPVPKVFYYHGGFNHSIIATDSVLGIGLDKYLGQDYDYYFKLGLPQYQRSKMRKEYIPIDALRYYISGLYPFPFEQDNVFSHIIYEGEIQYVLKKIFPDESDTLLFGYSENQLQWCKKNEQNMWKYLIEKKKLFSNDLLDIKRYTQDAPFTSTFPRESPGRAAVWIGYNIVAEFMKKNKNLSLHNLLTIKDYQHIFQVSEYNP